MEQIVEMNKDYEDWKRELIEVTRREAHIPMWQPIIINDEGAREWFESGASPYFTFRETYSGPDFDLYKNKKVK